MPVTTALVTIWMLRLMSPGTPCRSEFSNAKVAIPSVAEAIVEAANADPVPLDAAALLTSISYHESGFCPDAISAPGDVWSWGPWQIADIWLPPLPISLTWQAKKALEIARDSQRSCGDITKFVSGHCGGAPLVAKLRETLAYRLLLGRFRSVRIEPADRKKTYRKVRTIRTPLGTEKVW